MRIGILSDTHNRYATVEQALKLLKQCGVKTILHCGDIEDVDMVWLFEGFTAHFVFGNCDSDRAGLRQAIQESGAILHEPFGNLELEGRKLAWTHGDDQRLFRDVERSGQFDYLFYGHSHEAEQHLSGSTLVVNPGALYRTRVKSCVVLDLKSGQLDSLTIE